MDISIPVHKIFNRAKKAKLNNRIDYFLVFLILFGSGNPAFYKQDWAKIGEVLIAIVLFVFLRKDIDYKFFKNYLKVVSVFVGIFIIQFYNLGSISYLFVIGFFVRVFIGSIIFYRLGSKFSIVYFNVIYFLCLVSLPLYVLHIILGQSAFDAIAINTSPKSLFFYTLRPLHVFESGLRNSGMFWEPGGFQGYINLALFMSFNMLPYLYKKKRFRLFIILFTLLTTQSTTGFLLLGLLIGMYIVAYTNANKIVVIFSTIIFLVFGAFLFNNVDFLGDKINAQFDQAADNNGDFDNTRFSNIIFNLHYIYKNPLTGNGFDPKTRYADNPEVIAMLNDGENLGLGNGFTNFIASAGLLGMFWYLYCIYKSMKEVSVKDAWFAILIIIVLLQGEDLLRFPFFFGLPFFVPLYLNTRKRAPKSLRVADIENLQST